MNECILCAVKRNSTTNYRNETEFARSNQSTDQSINQSTCLSSSSFFCCCFFTGGVERENVYFFGLYDSSIPDLGGNALLARNYCDVTADENFSRPFFLVFFSNDFSFSHSIACAASYVLRAWMNLEYCCFLALVDFLRTFKRTKTELNASHDDLSICNTLIDIIVPRCGVTFVPRLV